MIKKWTDDILNFIRAECPLVTKGSINDLLSLVNAVFDTNFTFNAIKTMMTEKRIHAGIDPSVRVGWRTRPVGSEQIKKGMVRIKVAMPNVWKQKQVYIYEQTHNTIVPEGCVVIFLDGNNRNFDPDNLYMLTRGENTALNGFEAQEFKDVSSTVGVKMTKENKLVHIAIIKLKMAKIKVGEKYGLVAPSGSLRSDINRRKREQREKRKQCK